MLRPSKCQAKLTVQEVHLKLEAGGKCVEGPLFRPGFPPKVLISPSSVFS